MIEKKLIEYLNISVPVYAEVPESSSGKFVVIEKTGATFENRIDTATVVVQSYAGSLLEAAELNEEVKTAMFDLIAHDDITDVTLNSDYNFTDTATKKYRYQAVYQITYY